MAKKLERIGPGRGLPSPWGPRAYARRRAAGRRRTRGLVGAALLAALALTVGLASIAVEPRPLPVASSAHPQTQVSYREPFASPLPGWRSTEAVPSPSSVAAARCFAQGREGTVAFAVLDSEGRLRGLEADRSFLSASLVKVMLLLAYLDRVESAGASVSPEGRAMLEPMIEASDNAAASQVYGLVGADGLEEVARRADMTRFTASPAWGDSTITAGDYARLFGELDRLAGGDRRDYVRHLLSNITPEQSWGFRRARAIAGKSSSRAAGRPTTSGQLVHQAALVEHGDERLAVTVLSDGNPSFDYGVETVEGVARRLLDRGGREAGDDPGTGPKPGPEAGAPVAPRVARR